MSAVISQISWSFASNHRNNIGSHRRLPRGVDFRPMVYCSKTGWSGSSCDLSHTTVDVILDGNTDGNDPATATEPKRTAKIHDFCLGIPYGEWLCLNWWILGSILSRNLVTLGTGVLIGGALLALSFISLKIWREGKSSLPFILGQAAISAALCWKSFQAYTFTGKTFSSGLYSAVSAAMVWFYAYVVLSGASPPPKKLKSATTGAL
ncbi:FATTY ACID EXPORT 1, chloroplastic-like protein [Drosera capensis]